ncbi:TPA: HNH endonuclease [Clostridium perfringens]
MSIYKYCRKCKKNVDKYKPHKCVYDKRKNNMRIYDTKKWHTLREYVLSKHHVCERCGSIDKLQVHHIYKVNTNDISMAYDITNLCVLCHKCHT